MANKNTSSTKDKTTPDKKTLTFIQKLWALHNQKLIYLYEFAFTVIIYGLLLNFASDSLFGFEFTIRNTLALGIGFYFIKEEAPRIIHKSIPQPRYPKH